MAPNSSSLPNEDENFENECFDHGHLPPRKYKIHYFYVMTFSYIHIAAIYGIYLCLEAKWQTILFNYLTYVMADLGITEGVHRLWSHRSYKAKMPLQIILMVFNTLAFQNTAIYWVRDHRQHHKFCDTDKDPHNARRGLFYSHMGWLMTAKSNDVKEAGKIIDISDIYRNPVLCFQKKYAAPLITTICFVLPTMIPVFFWGESFLTAWHLNMLRYAVNLHAIWLINSFSHAWGYRPYEKSILPTTNLFTTLVNLGEGFHNYHHVFPWDYQASELGNRKLNVTTWFIDFFAWIGWAYDLKKVSKDDVEKRKLKTGDGSDLWGYYKSVDHHKME